MKNLLLFLFILNCLVLSGQSDIFQRLTKQYDQFKETSLTDRRFKHVDIDRLIQALPTDFLVKRAGQSVEGRTIYSVSIGNGPIQVLLWSQMHGDEPTATAASFDIFRFFQGQNDGFDQLRERLKSQLTLTFLPMLNPDGAEHFSRRNAIGIDLNRDALRLTTPEARLLKRVRDDLNADWGFNLHDQSRYYGAGYPSEEVATLAFLAPAYNFERSTNTVRERAMQLIAFMNKDLQTLIPGQVARYSDAFEPRAFGDNMQAWGTSTILIESGGNIGDREKQYIRQLNFLSLLSAFNAIADKSYQRFTRRDYNDIPYNKGGLFNDLLIRNLRYQQDRQVFTIDIGFDLGERTIPGSTDFYFRARIDDIGDLSYHQGYQELDGKGELSVEVAKVYPETLNNLTAVQRLDPRGLLAAGYGVIRLRDHSVSAWQKADIPLQVIGLQERYRSNIQTGSNPSLIIRDQEGTVKYAIVNGQLIEL